MITTTPLPPLLHCCLLRAGQEGSIRWRVYLGKMDAKAEDPQRGHAIGGWILTGREGVGELGLGRGGRGIRASQHAQG